MGKTARSSRKILPWLAAAAVAAGVALAAGSGAPLAERGARLARHWLEGAPLPPAPAPPRWSDAPARVPARDPARARSAPSADPPRAGTAVAADPATAAAPPRPAGAAAATAPPADVPVSAAPVPAGGAVVGLAVTELSDQLNDPTYATALEGDARIFVLERSGRIVVLENGSIRPTPFLDIVGQVGTSGEEGLLGLAFDPDFASNGVAYILYSNTSGASVLSRIRAGADPNFAPASSEEPLLTLPQPQDNHNGGTVLFGPDGNLYVGFGDGGGGFDPGDNAQDRQTLLGKLIRIDPGGPGAGYTIPPDNPFVGDPSTLDEIWALGLRNPYRFHFDWLTGDLWIADVGQNAREEVDFEPAGSPGGRNYGWDVKEGSLCNPTDPAPAPDCDDPSLVDPELEYAHAGGGRSITGGAVYRGPAADGFGEYFFGDFVTGEIWSYDRSTGLVTDRTAALAPAAGPPFQIVAISEDGFGALLVTHLGNGTVYRLGPTGSECSDGADNDGDGAADAADPGCRDGDDPSELASRTSCDDGYDNDRDGAIDFPADADCPSASSDAEAPPGGGGGGGGDGDGGDGSGGGGGGGDCGLGPELTVVLLALGALRRRR